MRTTNKSIIFARPDGGVSVVTSIVESLLSDYRMPARSETVAKAIPEGASAEQIKYREELRTIIARGGKVAYRDDVADCLVTVTETADAYVIATEETVLGERLSVERRKAFELEADAGRCERIPVETEEQFLARHEATLRARGDLPATFVKHAVVASLPERDQFRNVWVTCPVNGCKVDMPRAREIHRNHLRQLREPKLKALDVEFMKAQERNDTAAMATIAAKKQALRDVPADPKIEAAQTPEALKAVIPAALTAS